MSSGVEERRLEGRRIVLVVTGGIAAYKAAELLRLLRGEGADVRVVTTPSALRFIGVATLQALSGERVRSDLWDEGAEAAMGHIELARWAELVVVAPATAHYLARVVHGLADDLATTLTLATSAPLLVAPSMNRLMWLHPATVQNVALLKARGVSILEPERGEQACGEWGPGRLPEPASILEAVVALLGHARPWTGRRVVITAGPTREPIDEVRFLSNRSSGRMGYALAQAASEAGADVVLVSGPVSLAPPPGVHHRSVQTALEMRDAALAEAPGADVFVAVAAVADYRPEHRAEGKPAKDPAGTLLHLVPNPDIVAEIARHERRPRLVVGFAAETSRLEAHCRQKLERKGLDMIVGNLVGPDRGFEVEENELSVYWPGGGVELPRAPKIELARRLLGLMAERLAERDGVP